MRPRARRAEYLAHSQAMSLLNDQRSADFLKDVLCVPESSVHRPAVGVCGLFASALLYVDDGCCNSWRAIIQEFWPDAQVRLDGFHAIKRLTSTTTSTRHPWHGQFCKLLSQSIYSQDQNELASLIAACRRQGVAVTPSLRSRFVSRVVVEPRLIEDSIDRVITKFHLKQHPKAGELLTAKTLDAWANLRRHVRQGCLSDTGDVNLHRRKEAVAVRIGDEDFYEVRTQRGCSALEGYHRHQNAWLGAGRHTSANGLALVADGTLRWNRKRRAQNDSLPIDCKQVFGKELLSICDDHYRENLARVEPASVAPVRSIIPAARGGAKDALADGTLPEFTAARWVQCSAATAGNDKQEVDSVTRRAPSTQMLRHHGATRGTAPPPKAKAKQHVAKQSALRGRCRSCRMTDDDCRLYNRIQWCANIDVPFGDWVKNVYPDKKQDAADAARMRALRATGVRGRPPKHPSAKSRDMSGATR